MNSKESIWSKHRSVFQALIGGLIVLGIAFVGVRQVQQGTRDSHQDSGIHRVVRLQSNCLPRQGETVPRHPKACREGFNQAVKNLTSVQACRIVQKAVPLLYIGHTQIGDVSCRFANGQQTRSGPNGQGNGPNQSGAPASSDGDPGTRGPVDTAEGHESPPVDSGTPPDGGGCGNDCTGTPNPPVQTPPVSDPTPAGPTGPTSLLTVPDVTVPATGVTVHVPCTQALGLHVVNCRYAHLAH